MNSLSERLDYLLEVNGISAYKLANATGISQATISRLKGGGKNPNTSTLKQIASYFEVNPDWLLSGKGDMVLKSVLREPTIKYAPGKAIKLDAELINRKDEFYTLIKFLKKNHESLVSDEIFELYCQFIYSEYEKNDARDKLRDLIEGLSPKNKE